MSGLGVSPGIAIGPAYLVEGGNLPVHESHIPESEIEAERARFGEAVEVFAEAAAQAQGQNRRTARIGRRGDRLSARCACRDAVEFAARARRRRAHRRARINAERAVELEIDEIARSFAAMRDPYLSARGEDVRVVGARLIRNLIKKPYAAYSGVPQAPSSSPTN